MYWCQKWGTLILSGHYHEYHAGQCGTWNISDAQADALWMFSQQRLPRSQPECCIRVVLLRTSDTIVTAMTGDVKLKLRKVSASDCSGWVWQSCAWQRCQYPVCAKAGSWPLTRARLRSSETSQTRGLFYTSPAPPAPRHRPAQNTELQHTSSHPPHSRLSQQHRALLSAKQTCRSWCCVSVSGLCWKEFWQYDRMTEWLNEQITNDQMAKWPTD